MSTSQTIQPSPDVPQGCVMGDVLKSIPAIDDCSFALLGCEGAVDGAFYLVAIDASGAFEVIAFLDMTAGVVYRCGYVADAAHPNPRDAGEEPLVKLVGAATDATGQVVIRQPEGHWRRYSRWDRLAKPPVTQPDAVVRTLPQCGCGGYLGAPMMFDSFEEMLSYFFVVFSDAEAVNAKHAAILGGEACSI